ncbi:MAG: hypothetical protein ABI321_24300 [Polyangia bacterium]
MQRLRAVLLASAVLAMAGSAHAFPPGGPEDPAISDDAGADGGEEAKDLATTPPSSHDGSATQDDMAHRPKAAKAALPGCSAAGPGRQAPAGTLVLAAGLVAVALTSRKKACHQS